MASQGGAQKIENLLMNENDTITKRRKTKQSPNQGQNVSRDNTSKGTKRPKDKGKNEAHYLTCVANYLI